MATIRKVIFRNEELYHVFNRGIERRDIYINKKDYERALKLIKFYRHKDIPIRFSQMYQQPLDIRNKILKKIYQSEKIVEILSFCLMPNHFHFLLKQKLEKGIATFISNITNAYTKYFNTRNNRVGPLLQGTFKAVLVETDEQLIHLSRYIHLNPVVSSVITEERLDSYPWSSYSEYLGLSHNNISDKDFILKMFRSVQHYKEFVTSQIDYGKKLELIKHLTME